MAFGNLAGYEPGPIPGSTTFRKLDGTTMLLAGPPAENLKQRIDASAQFAPAPMAQAAPAQGGWATGLNDWTQTATDAGGGANAPDQIEANARAAMQRFGGQFGAPSTTVPASLARPTEAPTGRAAPQAQGASRAGYQPLGFGKFMSPDGVVGSFGGGSPAVTSQMIEQKAAGARALPTAERTTTAGGFEPSKEYLEGMARNFEERADLAEQIRGNNTRQVLAEQSIAADNAALQARQLEEQQQIQRDIDERVKRDEQIAERARQEFGNAKVNPERLFQGEGGTGRALISGIAAALGAAGAVLGRTENFGLNAVNAAIDRDIRAQEADVAIKREASNNALAQLQRSGLSRDQSRLVLRQAQRDWAAAQAESMRSAAKLDENNAQYQALRLGLEREQIQFQEDYRRESLGKQTRETTSQYAYEKAATRGGFRPDADQLGTAEKIVELEQKRANVGKTKAETAAKLAGEGDGKSVGSERTDKISAYVNAVGAANQIQGMLAGQDSEWNDPNSGLTDSWSLWDESERADRNKLDEATLALAAGAQAKRGKSDKDAELAMQDATGNGSINARLRGAQRVRESAIQGIIGEISTLPPKQQQEILESMPPETRDQVLKGMSR